jgi:hypothetical protein
MTTKPTDYKHPRFEWDDWEEDALERGMNKELASLGRSVYREAIQHAWPWSLRVVCVEPTLSDMLVKAPEMAKQFYETMLATDGFRYAFAEDVKSTEMIELCDLH